MTTTNDQISTAYARLKQEEAGLQERLRTLQVQIATLEMVGASGGAPAGNNGHATAQEASNPRITPPASPKARISQKAPQGALRDAILGALKATGKPLLASEIREYLKAHKYAYSLTPLHVSKTLTKLGKAKKVKGEGSVVNRRYRLA